jgi:molybdenum cofactor cytidylyltransferase
MASSIRVGVSELSAEVEAVVIVPADQPTTRAELIRELCRVHRETGARVVAPLYRGAQGPPVLFSRAVFGELLALRGDRGARSVLEAHRADAVLVEVDEPMPRDVDTRADHDALESLLDPPS